MLDETNIASIIPRDDDASSSSSSSAGGSAPAPAALVAIQHSPHVHRLMELGKSTSTSSSCSMSGKGGTSFVAVPPSIPIGPSEGGSAKARQAYQRCDVEMFFADDDDDDDGDENDEASGDSAGNTRREAALSIDAIVPKRRVVQLTSPDGVPFELERIDGGYNVDGERLLDAGQMPIPSISIDPCADECRVVVDAPRTPPRRSPQQEGSGGRQFLHTSPPNVRVPPAVSPCWFDPLQQHHDEQEECPLGTGSSLFGRGRFADDTNSGDDDETVLENMWVPAPPSASSAFSRRPPMAPFHSTVPAAARISLSLSINNALDVPRASVPRSIHRFSGSSSTNSGLSQSTSMNNDGDVDDRNTIEIQQHRGSRSGEARQSVEINSGEEEETFIVQTENPVKGPSGVLVRSLAPPSPAVASAPSNSLFPIDAPARNTDASRWFSLDV